MKHIDNLTMFCRLRAEIEGFLSSVEKNYNTSINMVCPQFDKPGYPTLSLI